MVSRKAKLRIEAPVNGGRNYNGPKVNVKASLSKTEPYAGNSSTAARYSSLERGSKNPTDMGTIRREDLISCDQEPSET